jgi:hypothetical protein
VSAQQSDKATAHTWLLRLVRSCEVEQVTSYNAKPANTVTMQCTSAACIVIASMMPAIALLLPHLDLPSQLIELANE